METKEFIVQKVMSADTPFINSIKHITFSEVERLLERKGDEYSTQENRLENFLLAARSENITPEQALWNFMLKHVLSLKKFINEVDEGKRQDPMTWVEKTNDITTYLVLLRAMVYKRSEIEQAVAMAAAARVKTELDARPIDKTLDEMREDKPKLTVKNIKPRIVKDESTDDFLV